MQMGTREFQEVLEREYRLRRLASMPTLCVGQAADLKYDDGRWRVWLSRCGLEDGEDRPVQVEELRDGRWVDRRDLDARWESLVR